MATTGNHRRLCSPENLKHVLGHAGALIVYVLCAMFHVRTKNRNDPTKVVVALSKLASEALKSQLAMRFTSLVTLVLYFDGSLRYPTDPGFPSERQCPRAACAACIVDDLSSPNKMKALLLGGRLLECSFQTTSGEVEYEGLLLGLEGLLNYFPDCMPAAYSALVPNLPSRVNKTLIRVQGDCKTVLQQMEGLACSRKLEPFYERAQGMIHKLTNNNSIEFQFEHIPRNKNQLCDGLALRLIQEQERRDYYNAMLQLQQLCLCSESSTSARCIMKDHLTMHSNTIPYSKRSPVYRFLAKQCFQNGDYSLLVKIGEQFEKEVEQVWPRSGFEQHRREELLVEATIYQITGLQKQPRKIRETAARARKRRYMLEKWKSLCNDVEDCLGDELLSTDVENLLDVVQENPHITKEDDAIAFLVEKWYAEMQSPDEWGVFHGPWCTLVEPVVLSRT